MRLLFSIDLKDYILSGSIFNRPSVRGIFIKDKKIAMVHSLVYDYYKLPGGGIEKDEQYKDTLIREVREESGLVVKPASIKEYGFVHRIQKGDREDIFIQDNYYYFIDCEKELVNQQLIGYEDVEHFTLEFIDPLKAIEINRNKDHGPKDKIMIEREALILELLIKEKYFN